MTKLKLGPLPDDKPVKLTVQLPADLHRDLQAYADYDPRVRSTHRPTAGKARHSDVAKVHCHRPGILKTAQGPDLRKQSR